MATWASILAVVMKLLDAIPLVSRLMRKSPTREVERENRGIDDTIKESDKTGRPVL